MGTLDIHHLAEVIMSTDDMVGVVRALEKLRISASFVYSYIRAYGLEVYKRTIAIRAIDLSISDLERFQQIAKKLHRLADAQIKLHEYVLDDAVTCPSIQMDNDLVFLDNILCNQKESVGP